MDVLILIVTWPFVFRARIENVNLALALVHFEDLALKPKISSTPKKVNEAPTGFVSIMEPLGIVDVFGFPLPL